MTSNISFVHFKFIDNVVTGGTIPDEIGLLSGLENVLIKNNKNLVGKFQTLEKHSTAS